MGSDDGDKVPPLVDNQLLCYSTCLRYGGWLPGFGPSGVGQPSARNADAFVASQLIWRAKSE